MQREEKKNTHRYKVYLDDGSEVYIDAFSPREAEQKILRKFRHIQVEEVELAEDVDELDIREN